MDNSQLYEEHLDEMFGTALLDNLTEEDVDRIITRVLCFLPNNGRLYKYRSIERNSFEYAYDGLKNIIINFLCLSNFPQHIMLTRIEIF